MHVTDQDFVASQQGKGETASLYSKPNFVGAGPRKKADKDEKKNDKDKKKPEKKVQCNYCKALDHVINSGGSLCINPLYHMRSRPIFKTPYL